MKAVYLVFANCTDARREAEFNEWYDDVHAPDILAAGDGGIVICRRYRLLGETDEPKYLAIYEVESEDPQATLNNMLKEVPAWMERGRIFDAMQLDKMTSLYELISTIER